jgi:hypothetical protein
MNIIGKLIFSTLDAITPYYIQIGLLLLCGMAFFGWMLERMAYE